MKTICSIYKSLKHEGMYLYVEKQSGTDRVPGDLLQRFGKPVQALTLLLQPDRKLARVDVIKVLEAIEQQGYYLQLPPQPDRYMSQLHEKNTKM